MPASTPIACARLGLTLCALGLGPEAWADDRCADSSGQIDVDRPDVTNSSVVVPTGSIQLENGVNWSDLRSARTFDGSNSRLRLSTGSCNEVLVDLPDYQGRLNGDTASGFGDVAPAVKHQFAPLPGDIQLSAILGSMMPTGAKNVADQGYVPYLQFPWSRELTEQWGLSGMLTTFWSPGQPRQHLRVEPTFVLERQLDERSDVFVEYVDEYRDRGGAAQSVNTGGALRFTRLQQIDFHLEFGLNQQAARYIFGVGYSIRWDNVL